MTSWSMCLRTQADKDAQEMIASKSQLRAQRGRHIQALIPLSNLTNLPARTGIWTRQELQSAQGLRPRVMQYC